MHAFAFYALLTHSVYCEQLSLIGHDVEPCIKLIDLIAHDTH